jgi:hypothetical protein
VSEEPLIRPELSDEELAELVPRGAGRDMSEEEGVPPDLGLDGESDLDAGLFSARRPLPTWPLAVSGVVALLAVGWWMAEHVGFRGLTPVDRAYARLLRLGRLFGRPLRAAETPWEWARAVGQAVPDAAGPVASITDLYVRSRFARDATPAPGSRLLWRQARSAWVQGWLRRWLPRSP